MGGVWSPHWGLPGPIYDSEWLHGVWDRLGVNLLFTALFELGSDA